jgi:hypothetical protein
LEDFGLKRTGQVTLATSPVEQSGRLWWYFRTPLGPAGTNSNTCNGDSGGPLFLDTPDGMMLAGTTGGGHNGTCLDLAFDTDVYAHRDWIAAVGGDDLGTAACGGFAPVGAAPTATFSNTGELGDARPRAEHQFRVPAGTVELRVTLNGVHGSDFNLSVQPNVPGAEVACRQDGPNPYGACIISQPVAGAWNVIVERIAGAGEYQVTAVALGVECGEPGNEGVECNDGDPCTFGDVCRSGECQPTSAASSEECIQYIEPLCAPLPVAGCEAPATPRRSNLALRNGTEHREESLAWTWSRGRAAAMEFGDPTVSTDYVLCVYADDGQTTTLAVEDVMPAGGDWRSLRRGFRYRRSGESVTGVREVRLRTGRRGRAVIAVEADGLNMSLPGASRQSGGQLRVQLHNDGGCWEAVHTAR